MRGPPHLIFIRQTGKTLGRGGFMVSKSIDPIDRHVGARIRMQRMVSGLSQTELGQAVGITFQQVQKYEKAANRVSTSRLQLIANTLKVAADFFSTERRQSRFVKRT